MNIKINKLKDKKSNTIYIIHKGNNVIGYKNTIDYKNTTELEQIYKVYRLSYSEITFLED